MLGGLRLVIQDTKKELGINLRAVLSNSARVLTGVDTYGLPCLTTSSGLHLEGPKERDLEYLAFESVGTTVAKSFHRPKIPNRKYPWMFQMSGYGSASTETFMPSTTPQVLAQARASYKKAGGFLYLTKGNLIWMREGTNVPELIIKCADARSLFCSKDGAPQAKLKLGIVDDEQGFNFTFTADQPQATVDRNEFKTYLTQIVSDNRARDAKAAAPQPPVVVPQPHPTAVAPVPRSAPPIAAPTPRSVSNAVSSPVIKRVVSVPNSRTPTTAPVTPSVTPNNQKATDDFRLRKKVLLKNPDLAALHQELVIGGQITESEFWDGREHLRLAEAAAESQKKGRSSQLVDPRPETVEGGDIKIMVTPQLVHDIFEEYPVVARAYHETVPHELSEGVFWKRYFQSKLFNSNRASIRSSAAQHVVKDDPIFDKYLEKEDDELEPRRQRDEVVPLVVNLLATQEDHAETGNEKDVSMQAGKQRGALPLIRKFNEHSERLLNSSLGDLPAAKRRRLEEPVNEPSTSYSEIDLDDLHEPDNSTGIVLDMQDRQRYFQGRVPNLVDGEGKPKAAYSHSALSEARANLTDWETKVSTLSIERKAGDAAMLDMSDNVKARLQAKTKQSEIPPNFLGQMRTCQTAANEFLRQFWSAIYPPSIELPTLAVATPAQKAAKAAKMAGYLARTHEKVAALINAANFEGVDPVRVQNALEPTMVAVNKALHYYHTRRPGR